MTLPRQKFRELLFQTLFTLEDQTAPNEQIEALLMEQLKVPRKEAKRAMEQALNIAKNFEKLDKIIEKLSTSYELHRIPRTERTILRLALWEMDEEDEIPPKVALSEAIRLGRKFCSPEAAHFINALLDHHMKANENPQE